MAEENNLSCRLCSKQIRGNDFDVLEDITKNMLEVLLLKLDLNISIDPVMCNDCATKLQKSFDFKSMCLNNREENVHADIKVDPLSSCPSSLAKVCSFCFKLTEMQYTSLYESKKNVFLIDMVEKHIPELITADVAELIACETCLDSLQAFFILTTNCLNAEENNKLTWAANIGDIGLFQLQQFRVKTDEMIRRNEMEMDEKMVDCIKKEGLEDYVEFNIKTEEVEIKSELSDAESCEAPAQEASQEIYEHSQGILQKCDSVMNKPMLLYPESQSISNPEVLDIIKCSLCPYQAKKKFNLTRHELTHKLPSEVTIYRCEFCLYETKYKHKLSLHVSMHKGCSVVAFHKCNQCNFRTKHKSNLYKHLQRHESTTNGTMFKCDQCPYVTTYKGNLQPHKRLAHGTNPTTFKCDVCNFETKHRGSLTKHALRHRDEKEVTTCKCNKCDYQSIRLDTLRQHMMTHESSRAYACALCSFETKRKDSLRRHMVTHRPSNSVEMYKCLMCRFQTKHKTSIKAHILMHKSRSMTKREASGDEGEKEDSPGEHGVVQQDSEIMAASCKI